MKPKDIVEKIVTSFNWVVSKSNWGETSLFYNPGKALPNGVYFCTIMEKNGDNDKASQLDRSGVFRFSVGISKSSYENLFGPKPKRPSRGCIIDTELDFTAINELYATSYLWLDVLGSNLKPESFYFCELTSSNNRSLF